MQATLLLTTKSLFESPTTSSSSYTPTNTSQTVLAHHSHRPIPTTLPLVHAEQITDKHLQPSQYQITGSEDIQVSMKSSLAQDTMAQSPVLGHSSVGQVTTMQTHDQSDNQVGLMSATSQQSAPVASTETAPHTLNGEKDGDKHEARKDVTDPNAPQPPAATSVKGNTTPVSQVVPSQPSVVVVRQFQKVKPYTGQTSHKSFKEHFERVAKANAWVSEEERMQNLALALEGPALECLREIKEEEWCLREIVGSVSKKVRTFG